MKIKGGIDAILARRKDKCRILRDRREEVAGLTAAFEVAENEPPFQPGHRGDSNNEATHLDISQEKELSALRDAAGQLLKALDAGIERFSRDYVNLVIVGGVKQGKSKLLQAVGGFSMEAGDKFLFPLFIPYSIINAPEMERGTVRAVIHFQSREEILSVVSQYIKTIDPEYFQYHSLQFDHISRLDPQEFEKKIDEYDVYKIVILQNLSKIVTRFDEIRPWAGHSSIESNDPDEIQAFVLPNNGKDPESPERLDFIRYLAVQRADMYLPFYSDVGKVRLVDTVGIGSTQYGVEEAMLHTVDHEADAVIVVTMPGMADLQMADLRIYRLLKDNFKNRKLKQWLYYLVNQIPVMKYPDLNGVQSLQPMFCRAAERRIRDKFAYSYEHIIDCSDPQQVQDDFIIPVLTSLIENLDEIDSCYTKEVEAAEERFQRLLSGTSFKTRTMLQAKSEKPNKRMK